MPYTIDSALDDDLVEVIERDDYLGFYKIKIGTLRTPVSIEVRRLPTADEATFHRSHSIKTPSQIAPYHTSRLVWDYVAYALHHAISGITDYYRAGVKDGHTPEESWLVKD